MKLVQSLLASALLVSAVAYAGAGPSDTTTFQVNVPFDGHVLSSKDLLVDQTNFLPVCYTANAPAVLTISRTTTPGAIGDYPVSLVPADGQGVGTIIDANTVEVAANTTSYGPLCDGTVASAIAFKYVFDAPDGSKLATEEGKAPGLYSTDVTVSIAAK